MTTKTGFPGAGQPANKDDLAWMQRAGKAIDNILVGKLNASGSVTLKSGGTSTTVSDARCSPSSVINLMATSAAGAVALDQWSVQTRTNGSFTITHISTSTSTCTASYIILG